MSLKPCDAHGARIRGKLATCYWAWFNADGERSAWLQRLCAPCLTERMAGLLRMASEASLDLTVCPACGADSSQDLDAIYATVYLPRQEAREYALTTCASCAARLRLLLQENAEKLPDRQWDGRDKHKDDFEGVLP